MIMKYDTLSYHGCNSGKNSIQQLITDISQAMKAKLCFHHHFKLQIKLFAGISNFWDSKWMFFQCILTSNIHINCLLLWFTKAIVCCTGKYSCISPVDVCYSQHLSALYHTSISLLEPRLLFGPSDVWFWLTRSFTG